ncbi:MAG: serine hydrolase domain-containing protein, partial [Bacteroidota bacterium]
MHHFTKLTFPLFWGLILLPFIGMAQLTEEDEQFIRSYMAENQLPGLSIAIAEGQALVYVKAFGVKDQDTQVPLTPQTPMQAASVSKSLASILALRYAQSGVLDLDAPINQYLSSWKLAPYKKDGNSVPTTRQLLNHTGGTNLSGFLGFRPSKRNIPSLLEVLKGKHVHPWESGGIKVKYLPGEAFHYSGGGYCVVEQSLQDLSGKSLQEQMSEQVFGLAGMERSYFSYQLSEDQIGEISTGHSKKGKPIKGQYHVYPQQAAAGLWTTPSDLVQFLMAIQESAAQPAEDNLLRSSSVEELCSIPLLNGGAKSFYNFGFGLLTDSDQQKVRAIRKTGANWGFTS